MSMFASFNVQNFDSKENCGRKSFSWETKASKSCFPIKRMCLWCPIMKRMMIITRIQVYPIWGMNFDSKQNGGKKHFLQNQSIKIMYPNEENMFMCLIMKGMEIIKKIKVYPIWWMNFDSKEKGRNKSFSCHAEASRPCNLMRKIYL